ncbi:lipoamide acyltransferase component of branched-chain alpha-keto acid dehydrogenase complex [Paenibacillus baekrokdamisoli]|uniref:Dihydrolipoamide acetyltransferase component of pyruvate dehydrogenase complex n=1 Tax=Paenibacillus baekrokdamisoli TaxID=1712516 RepID=A0A3G9IY54_9BACL|nr:dihydrolipoamide acetyltransferase family protein [Paenibacillus baekrokdamisoli]MBB3069568.1 2-oxoisovalerate dehydrogenase E2 component (dihydrolipoyl transacylase) [Paenibacillus baekrokdamisoli]BBH21075.1 lipoamide acyltransferase component of branched-chain alpha-keto acid dehydrogenase complex [Paenibacillus baekrokdamisoli]
MKTLTEVVMPQLAESLVSATIEKWLKQPGDSVDMYEPLCEIITDKVNAELPSTLQGTLVEILVEAGVNVPVGTPVCIIEIVEESGNTNESTDSDATQAGSTNNRAAEGSTSLVSSDARAAVRAQSPTAASADSNNDTSMRNRFSPAVQQLAAEHGITLSNIDGTGLGGRITRKDVLAYVASGSVSKPAAVVQTSAPHSVNLNTKETVRSSGLHLSETPRIPNNIEVEGQSLPGRSEYFIDVTPVRNAIARNMRQSVTEIPHAWMMMEVDVTNLVVLRNKLKDDFKKREGVNLTYLAFWVKAVVNAIKDFPIMNSVWAVDKIIVKRDIHLGLAVGTEDAVKVPVIKNADQKNIAGLAREIEDLARKTREGKLTLSDMDGGTFTVNNTGSFGSILSYPIINYPQAAIVTFESIVKRPVVINDMIAVRSMANICLSLDHRILDGVICGRFLQRVKENLEGFNLDTKLY